MSKTAKVQHPVSIHPPQGGLTPKARKSQPTKISGSRLHEAQRFTAQLEEEFRASLNEDCEELGKARVLARKLGVTDQMLSEVRRGKRRVPEAVAVAAAAMGVA
jgi:hypothetical protein